MANRRPRSVSVGDAVAPSSPRRLGGRAARIGWTVGDQAISSITNFGLSFAVARQASPEEFGAFALSFSVYIIVVGLSRAVSTDALGVRFATSDDEAWSSAAGRAVACALVVGLGFSAVVVGIAHVSGAVVGSMMLVLAACIPALLVQDAWRFAFFARGRPSAAAQNDAIWLATMVATFAALLLLDRTSPRMLLAAWGASAAVAAVAGIAQSGVRPALRGVLPWMKQHQDLTPQFAGEFTIRNGLGQLVVYLLGVVVTLETVAAFRGAQLLFGPINILLLGAVPIAVPEGARLLARSKDAFAKAMFIVSAVAAGAVIVWCTALVLLLPDSMGDAALGDTWPSAETVIPFMGIYLTTVAAALGPTIALRVMERPGMSLVVRAGVAPLVLVGGVLGGHVGGASGAALGMAVPMVVGNAGWWAQFKRELRVRGVAGTDLQIRAEDSYVQS